MKKPFCIVLFNTVFYEPGFTVVINSKYKLRIVMLYTCYVSIIPQNLKRYFRKNIYRNV